ncbi:restriction endonuclease subunit S [Aeromonas sp. PrichA-15]|uniref:restriction endonuclease subunit S n=1 Tax=Aeromonas sp. PrichA-15 TaxID=2823360 RepID=UPI001B337C9D|nr:restriction endonuclease subunit S [Aeromonas sp. PrichA-15]MBP4032947.1 restriction endonuclease subunit S [Aeromonas sp. PrichA-15]
MSEVVANSPQGLTGKYKQYPEYKDSGVEWVGDMPRHWQSKPAFAVVMDECIKNSDGAESNVLSLSYGNIVERDVETNFGLLPESFNTYQIVNPGDIILRLTDLQNDKRSLRVGRSTLQGIITSAYLKLSCSGELNDRYAYRLLHSYDTTKVFYGMGGGLRQSMKFEDFRRLPFLVPPLEEQRTIAAFLDYETSRIDRLIAQQQRLIELLKEKRQTVISHAVTKGLNPNAPMKDSGVEWLGQVPEHWQIQKTAWHFTAQKGRNGQMLTKEYCGENSGDYPVYSGQTENNGIMGRIDSFEFDFGNDGCLFSTTVGAKAMSLSLLKGKFSLSQNCMVIIPRENNAFSVSFAFYHFQPLFSYERGLIPEHMQASFRMDDLYQYSIAMPPVSEQIEISDFINGEVIKIDYLVQIAEKAITLMQERRSALISAAVTGKIDLRGWTPPAEEVAA